MIDKLRPEVKSIVWFAKSVQFSKRQITNEVTGHSSRGRMLEPVVKIPERLNLCQFVTADVPGRVTLKIVALGLSRLTYSSPQTEIRIFVTVWMRGFATVALILTYW